MNSKIKDEHTDFLFKAILSLKNMDECYCFFEDLCTVPELKAISQRLVVAKMLSENACTVKSLKKQGRQPPPSAE